MVKRRIAVILAASYIGLNFNGCALIPPPSTSLGTVGKPQLSPNPDSLKVQEISLKDLQKIMDDNYGVIFNASREKSTEVKGTIADASIILTKNSDGTWKMGAGEKSPNFQFIAYGQPGKIGNDPTSAHLLFAQLDSDYKVTDVFMSLGTFMKKKLQEAFLYESNLSSIFDLSGATTAYEKEQNENILKGKGMTKAEYSIGKYLPQPPFIAASHFGLTLSLYFIPVDNTGNIDLARDGLVFSIQQGSLYTKTSGRIARLKLKK
jgi:hypothetical protein